MAWYGRGKGKYGAIKTTVDGIEFHSKHEAVRYGELKVERAAGLIRNLKLQVRYPLVINGVKIADYYADFVYDRTQDMGYTWVRVVEDRKSKVTAKDPVYRLKKKLMLAIYGIDIYES